VACEIDASYARSGGICVTVDKGWGWLVIIGLLNSTVRIYYFALVLIRVYMGELTREVHGMAHRPYQRRRYRRTRAVCIRPLELARSTMALLS